MLTYLQYIKVRDTDYLVMNSVALLNKCIEPLKKYKKIYYWGQNDQPGKEALEKLLSIGMSIIDCRCTYENFKDLNEKYGKPGQFFPLMAFRYINESFICFIYLFHSYNEFL